MQSRLGKQNFSSCQILRRYCVGEPALRQAYFAFALDGAGQAALPELKGEKKATDLPGDSIEEQKLMVGDLSMDPSLRSG